MKTLEFTIPPSESQADTEVVLALPVAYVRQWNANCSGRDDADYVGLRIKCVQVTPRDVEHI